MKQVTHRFVTTNGIRMHVAEQGSGPLVVLCHGFPECWLSWRHQLAALAGAGYRAVAPDQRGYGQTDRPEAIEEYNLCRLAGDIVGLVHALGEERATIVGHDWGAPVAWTCALVRPDIFHSLCLLSVPYRHTFLEGPRPTDAMRARFGDRQFYVLYFQDVGPPEREFESDVRSGLLKAFYSLSGDAPPEKRWQFVFDRSKRFIDTLSLPEALPSWLKPEELDFFAQEFTRTGFRGALNWYRNIDRNWELLGFLRRAKIRQPTLFIAGEHDAVIAMNREAFDRLEEDVPQLGGKHLIPKAGHWVQQERPEEVNRLLLEFLGGVGRAAAAMG